MRHLIGLFLFLLLVAACNSSAKEQTGSFLDSKKLTVQEKLKLCLEDDYLKGLGFSEEQCTWLKERYSANKYKPIWLKDTVLSEKGLKLKETMDRSLWLGIPENRIRFLKDKPTNPVLQEVLLTAQSALVLQDLKTGMISDTSVAYKKPVFASSKVYDSLLKKPDTVEFAHYFLERSCPDTNYRFLAKHVYNYCSLYPLDRTTFTIKTFKEDSIHTLSKTAQALHLKGYLPNADTSSVDFISSLKLFQIHNGLKPDGKVGKYTAQALNESTYSKILRASISMDKYRRDFKYPEKYVYINIPEYLLRFFVNDSLKSVHNIVVGKVENRTPTLTSKIHSIVVYPYWKVPYSIASKEILPDLKRNSAYLTKNNYKLYKGETEISPYSVNWSKIKKNTFPYQVVQQPGPKNSLGIIKFEFHNNYSVYVHDTPSKNYFRSDVRAFSHGCMRCENPVDLGKLILDYDTLRRKGNHLTPDSLDSLIGLQENYVIKLLDRVPVFVEYNSVTADREKMIFHLDIYQKDEEYLHFMRD